jgi:pimeloyl-ACP methyl ester carboxylesterase
MRLRTVIRGRASLTLSAGVDALTTPDWQPARNAPSESAFSVASAEAAPAEALPAFELALELPALTRVARLVVQSLALTAGWTIAVVMRSRSWRPATAYGGALAVWLCATLLVGQLLRLATRHAALVAPQELATRDSRFATVGTVCVHYLERLPTRGGVPYGGGAFAGSAPLSAEELAGSGAEAPRARAIVHLNHGFGASCLSYLDVIAGLADGVGAVVVAHDRVGFGLTDRPEQTAEYAPSESRALARELVCMVGAQRGCERAPLVLVGHSLGAQLSILQALDEPKRVRALVLVAPALPPTSPARQVRQERRALVRGLGGALQALALLAAAARSALLRALTPLLLLLLRAAVYSPRFWAGGLGSAWRDRSRVTAATLARYRRPSLAKQWDVGMLRFARAMAATAGADELRGGSPPLELLKAADFPVLIVHGRDDAVTPIGGSRALAAALGARATLVELDDCGHVPHEECPARFLDVVLPWLAQRTA